LLSEFVLPARLARMEQVLSRRTRRLTALIEGLHDPHNVAACMRTCEGLGIQDLHVVPEAGDELEPSRVVATGSGRWLTLHQHSSTEAALEALRRAGYRVVATELAASAPPTPPAQLEVQGSLCIAFGSERDGISRTLRQGCAGTTCVPMYGFVQSFNISVAFALVMQVLRGRMLEQAGREGDLTQTDRASLRDAWLLEEVPRAHEIIHEIWRRSGADGEAAGR